jgi:hypothetical protein
MSKIHPILARYPEMAYFEILDIPAWGPGTPYEGDSITEDDEPPAIPGGGEELDPEVGEEEDLPPPVDEEDFDEDDLPDVDEEDIDEDVPSPIPTIPTEPEGGDTLEPEQRPECRYTLGNLIHNMEGAPLETCALIADILDECPGGGEALEGSATFKRMQQATAQVLTTLNIDREKVMWAASCAATLGAFEFFLRPRFNPHGPYGARMMASSATPSDVACYLTTLAFTEGAMQPNAFNPKSAAYGYLQLLPQVGRGLAESISNVMGPGITWDVPGPQAAEAAGRLYDCGKVMCLTDPQPMGICNQSIVAGRYVAGVAGFIGNKFFRGARTNAFPNGTWAPANDAAAERFAVVKDELSRAGYILSNPHLLWTLMRTYHATGWGPDLDSWKRAVQNYTHSQRAVLKYMASCINLTDEENRTVYEYPDDVLDEPVDVDDIEDELSAPEEGGDDVVVLPDEEEIIEEDEDLSDLGPPQGGITPDPTPGNFYQFERGDSLLSRVGDAYGVGAGGERLRLAKAMNAWDLNLRFHTSPKPGFTAKHFKQGIISLKPVFGDSYEAQYSGPTGGRGNAYAIAYFPTRQELGM